MAEGSDSQEKTEEPTQKRKEDARKDGQVTSSKEMFVFTTFLLTIFFLLFSHYPAQSIVGVWAQHFVIEAPGQLDVLIFSRLSDAVLEVGTMGLAFGLPMICAIVLTQMAIGGLNFSAKSIGFKIEKADPIAGFKRMFSLRSLVELVKALLKVVLLLAVSWFALEGHLPSIGAMAVMAPGTAIGVFASILINIFWAMALVLALIGGIDLAWQVYSNRKKLMMSLQEIKDETKEAEGSPEVKGQIRRRQIEASRRAAERASVSNVGDATAVVTNPSHYAVALRYMPNEQDAPTIVAMGSGKTASDIKAAAKRHGVTIIGAPPLARALYFTGVIGAEISTQLYSATAALLAHVWKLDHGVNEDLPDLEIPIGFQFDEFGRPIREDPRHGSH